MKDSIFHDADLVTPCYVYDLLSMSQVLERLSALAKKADLRLLYSIKSANLVGLLQFIQPWVNGFSCSSLFELKLGREVLQPGQSLHITTPGYRPDECEQVFALADYVNLNSVSQWSRLARSVSEAASCGLRINPDMSFVNDKRYDPCRPLSKLGITHQQLSDAMLKQHADWSCIDGITLHNNCESSNFNQLQLSVERVLEILEGPSCNLQWFNLGGGYLFHEGMDEQPILRAVSAIRERFRADIFIEPGKAVSGQAGYLVATVIDIIEHGEKHVAILDTSINHLPEVFEYQYQPQVGSTNPEGQFEYRLAGCSCLSGDLFGDYRFASRLHVGSRVVFSNVGAYMQVKANTFNGINLPATYLYDGSDGFTLVKTHDYQDYRARL